MQLKLNTCHCGSSLIFENCCQPLLLGLKTACSAETLMRSRFSAYVLNNYDYILATYGSKQRASLSLVELQESAENTQWLKLIVHSTNQTKLNAVADNKTQSAKVEFSAYYQVAEQYYLMHETSDFIFDNGQWYYTTGTIHKDSGPYAQQRNDLCLCNSGKKYKKCCANK